jgi:hypothetical protein
MVVLVDILHPAHVHVFRHTIQRLSADGHRVVVTARRKEMSLDLLDAYGIPYTLISEQRHGFGLVIEMLERTWRLCRICRRERPNLLMGIMGPSIAVAGRLLGIPAWVFYDTENAWITNGFAYPLARRVYTPACYLGPTRRNQIRYAGYHELAYLHPNRFTPDPSIPARHGIDPNQPYFIVRFVGWQASHDVGEKGMTRSSQERLVHELQAHGRVLITSEAGVPESLQPLAVRFPVQDMHHVMAFSRLVVGESATMASEAAVLGVPAVFISDTSRGYTLDEERRYGLVRNFTNAQMDLAIGAARAIASDPAARETARAARARLLSEQIDVTGYFVDQIQTAFGA